MSANQLTKFGATMFVRLLYAWSHAKHRDVFAAP